jgi:hypothetical protein
MEQAGFGAVTTETLLRGLDSIPRTLQYIYEKHKKNYIFVYICNYKRNKGGTSK